MGVPQSEAKSAVRISLGDHNQLAEADKFNQVFDKLYDQFKN